jgi:hypothetical protein
MNAQLLLPRSGVMSSLEFLDRTGPQPPSGGLPPGSEFDPPDPTPKARGRVVESPILCSFDRVLARGGGPEAVSPADMGKLLKVHAMTRGIDDELIGFRDGDRSHRL